MKPAPDDPVERALWQYAGLAHGPHASHPLDWGRFYRFIVVAHSRRKGWDYTDVQARLKEYGFTEGKAKEMAEVYWHGRCVLSVKARWFQRGYTGWMKKNGSRLT
jgi:hypothetical protein